MDKYKTDKLRLENVAKQEDRILALLREERRRTKERFPLFYALIATFGLIATVSGFSKWIDTVPFLKRNPIILIIIGVSVLIATGTAYRRIDN